MKIVLAEKTSSAAVNLFKEESGRTVMTADQINSDLPKQISHAHALRARSAWVARELGIRLASLDEVYAAADYLSLHVGLTPQTNGMINADSLKKMKKGVRLVNCARGELIDDAALAAALQSGHVAGAALDVFTEEPPKGSPLLALENVLATPHIAGSTHEAQDAVGMQIARQVKDYLKDGVIQNAVNVPSVSHDEYVEMEPYILLAERLGAFLAQAITCHLEEISIRYSGRIAEWKTDLIRNGAIKGILNLMLSERANLVNAASLAQERGLQVHDTKNTETLGGWTGNVLSLLVKTNQKEMLVKGAILHGRSPRLLAVDDIDVEAPLEHDTGYPEKRDAPGRIGKAGTALASHQVNIANFALVRRAGEGRDAMSVVQVDTKV